jgi:thymidylate synthase (FAD)
MYDINDSNYRSVLDHGHCYLVDTMGTDSSITQAARISYGAGTKSTREDRGLIRYLFRNRHSSPIEMCEVKYHLKVPIFVMRQLIRHRTASVNEYSARYSIMSDEFYVPEPANIQPQALDNKQGRAGTLSQRLLASVRSIMQITGETAHSTYRVLLGEDTHPDDLLEDLCTGGCPPPNEHFPGVARELARTVLPVSFYTEVYWKQNLWNLFHLLKLRTDSHAQYETRMVADAMYDLIEPRFPAACEAFEDYIRDAVTLSRMEVRLMHDLLTGTSITAVEPEHYDLTKRELAEFIERFALNADG